MKVKKWVGGVIAIAVAAALLYLSFRKVEWDSFIHSIGSCDWHLLLLSALTGAAMPVCRALRWRQTVQPFYPEIRKRDSVSSLYVGYLANLVVPGMREPVRCVLIHEKSGGKASYDEMIGVAIIEIACDTLCIFLLFLMTAVISSHRYMSFLEDSLPSQHEAIWRIVAIVVIILIGLAIAARIVKTFKDKSKFCSAICKFFTGIKVGLKSITKLQRPWLYILYTMLLWFIYWLQLYLGVRSIPSLVNVSAQDCLFLTFAVAISTLVPVPGGFGAYHFMIASALSTLCAVEWNDGLAVATLVHESQTILLIIIGIFSSAMMKACYKKKSICR